MVYCDRCDRYFPHNQALWQHERDSSNHWLCHDCDRDFASWTGLKEHYVQSRRHHYCQRCDDHFDDDFDLLEHMTDYHHGCSKCRRMFDNEVGLEEHFRQSAEHHYCAPCNRHFLSSSNLNSHLNSSTHRPKDVRCPLKGCSLSFVSNSALVLHMESGSCRSGIDRATVNRVVRQYDTHNVITDPSRLLTDGGPNQRITYIAGDGSWNGHAYECYLCHGTYRNLNALNQHLASPRHQEKIYVCPLNTCRLNFSTLSGLVQHIESQRCGVAKFKSVQNALEGIMGGMKRLAM